MSSAKHEKKHEVSKNEEKVSTVTIPQEYDYSAYAGQGFETHTQDDYARPFLGVLQANSPILDTHADAKAGMLINTVTKQVYDGKAGIVFIPVHTKHNVLEWKPDRGGFVAEHELGSEFIQKVKAEQEFGKWKMVKGDLKSNDLTETFSVYGLFVNEQGTPEQMVISFSSTKIKIYKSWMTTARTVQAALPNGQRINPPIFAHRYRIKTAMEKNAKGSFYNFNIGFDGGTAEKCRLPTNDPLFLAAVSFFELVKEGTVKAAYETQTEAGSHEEVEEEIPFKQSAQDKLQILLQLILLTFYLTWRAQWQN